MKRTLPLLILLLNSCTEEAAPPKPEIKVSRHRAAAVAPAPIPPEAAAVRMPPPPVQEAAPPAPVIKADPSCIALSPSVHFPHSIDEPSLLVIGFLKTCTLESGESGFEKGSPWTAMGFPCSKGRGRIDRKGGSENSPSLINFVMPTSCPMEPANSEEAERVIRQRLKIPADSKLIAYYPLSIDFWEFAGLEEKDKGFVLALYTQQGLNAWNRFNNKGDPIRVRLYGRENAWERGKTIYEVQADIVHQSRSTFRLDVKSAKALNDEERAAVRSRCESLKPSRDCNEIFD